MFPSAGVYFKGSEGLLQSLRNVLLHEIELSFGRNLKPTGMLIAGGHVK